MNLQICFMNETADGSEIDNQKELFDHLKLGSPQNDVKNPYVSLPAVSNLKQPKLQQELTGLDFFSQQAKLQMEARTALAQAKELARVQMQVERQQRKYTRISDLVRQSLEKVMFWYSNRFGWLMRCPSSVGDSVSVGLSTTQ